MKESIDSSPKPKVTLPEKPYDGFELFPHQTGRWAKKIRGQIRFYGRWGRSVAGQIVMVDDVPASAREAKIEFDRCWPYHSEGKEAPTIDEGLTVRELANRFIQQKRRDLQSDDLSGQCFEDYFRTCKLLVRFLGKQRVVDHMQPPDFARLRRKLAKDCNVVTLRNRINRSRVVFNFAFDERLIAKPVTYGQSFGKPAARLLRKSKNESGPNLFHRDEVLMILDALNGKPVTVPHADTPVEMKADPVMKAMVLLGLNGGMGNTDVSNVPLAAIDLETGWVDFARVKTEVQRRIPLWPETIAAVKSAIAARPKPKTTSVADLAFLTNRGTQFVRVQPHKTQKHRHTVINGVLRRFSEVMTLLQVGQRPRIGFYTLRHNFETIGGGAKDQIATSSIMGHCDDSMASNYREGIDDERLKAVTDHVRTWLWPDAANSKLVKKASNKSATKKASKAV